MKHFVLFFLGMFLATLFSEVRAQAGGFVNELTGVKEPRFIDHIEITGGSSVSGTQLNNEPAGQSTPQGLAGITMLPASSSTEQLSSIQFKYAVLMNREAELISNRALYGFIDDWWGTRYRYGGNSRKGIDCSAFSSRLFQQVYGIDLPRTAREQYRLCQSVSREEMKEGDLLFFNTRGGVSHVGVYLGDGYFVHSSTNQGVVISNLSEEYYQNRLIGAGRTSAALIACPVDECLD